MSTKVTIIGESDNKPEVKPIVFKKILLKDMELEDTDILPHKYENIELIARKWSCDFDLMFAYNSNRNQGYIFIGYFNDGVVAAK